MLNSHYSFAIYVDYIKNMLKNQNKMNELKIE